MKRIVLNILGFAALILGAFGVLLPILPATPFVLCAAGCFSAANPAMYRRLSGGKYIGEFIRGYRERTGISTAARVRALVFLWASLLISGTVTGRPYVLIVLAAVGAAVTAHILTINRKK